MLLDAVISFVILCFSNTLYNNTHIQPYTFLRLQQSRVANQTGIHTALVDILKAESHKERF